MPTILGASNARIARARELLTRKGRGGQQRFLFEGPTLLEEALISGAPPETVFATQAAYDGSEVVRTLEAAGTPVFIVDPRTAKKLSDVHTPSGLVAIAPIRLQTAEVLLSAPGTVLVLAGVSDPGNAGSLIRSADAFGVRGVIFGEESVDPHNPKVVRAAMGSLFRLPVSVANPEEVALLCRRAGWTMAGLEQSGAPIGSATLGERLILVVGQERHGLGAWAPLCDRTLSIEMAGRAESLNAAIAGSIALYAASRASL
ncbi:MAG: RNA methyltransferase [Vulcanimicrobiaceae bacterium]